MELRTTSFGDVEAKSDALRDYLRAQGIVPHPDSTVGRAMTHVSVAAACWRSQQMPVNADVKLIIEDLASIEALASVVLGVRAQNSQEQIVPRLRDLAAGDPRFITQGARSNQRDRIFELVCWHICSQFAKDVAFSEPDIRCEYRGKIWGIACKTLYGSPERSVKAIRKGWNQVLASAVPLGLIVAHLSNLFPHDQMYGRDPVDGDVLAERDENALRVLFESNLRSVTSPVEKKLIESLNRDPKTDSSRLCGVLYAAHSLPYFRRMRVRQGGTVFQRMLAQRNDDMLAFVSNFNLYWQDLAGDNTIAIR